MSFRWEVNHNREQRTPERAVRRSAVQPSSRPREKQTAKSAVQSNCAADHSGLDRSGFSKLEQLDEYHLTRRSLQAALVLCADLSLDKSAVKCRRPLFLTVRCGASPAS